ncbi:MAG: efflux transporter periplasmic adaptor subunit, partial [Gammaproteobacteria bacterium]
MNPNNLKKKIVSIRDNTAGQDVVVDNRSRRRRKRLFMIGAGVVLLVVLAFLAPGIKRLLSATASVSASRLSFATVERGPFVRDIVADGRVVAAVSPTLYTTSAGSVTLKVNAGDTVKKNQVLAVIDSPALSSSLLQEQSTLLSMQTDLGRERINARKASLLSQEKVDLASVMLEAAQREMKRAEAAWGYHVISQLDYAKAKDDLAAAQLKHKLSIEDIKL